MPDNEAIRDWVKRCSERPATVRTLERERKAA
jgi:glutathione S-transferase